MPTPEDSATLTAHLQGVDAAARKAEAKWGMDRLPLLVDPELRARFLRQQVRWQAATGEAWGAARLSGPQLEAVVSASAGMVRAWQALDAAATESGQRPITPDVWEIRLADGSVGAIVRDGADASLVLAEAAYQIVYSLAEVANVIDALPEAIRAAKRTWPAGTIEPQRRGKADPLNDPVPF